MSLEFTVATYNVGVSFDTRNVLYRTGGDSSSMLIKMRHAIIKGIYEKALEGHKMNPKPEWYAHPDFHVSDHEKVIVTATRHEILAKAFQIIFKHSEIVLLQEVEESLSFIEKLLPAGYKIAYEDDKNKIDTAVVWNSKRFEMIKQIGYGDRKATIVQLQDRTLKKVIQVASVHIPGYTLCDPQQNLKGEHLEGDMTVMNTLQLLHDSSFAIFGGDFNGEYEPTYLNGRNLELAQRRFKLLQQKDFLCLANPDKTAYNRDLKGPCQLDHLFVKMSNNDTMFDFKRIKSEEIDIPLEDINKNPSDHCPLFFLIKF